MSEHAKQVAMEYCKRHTVPDFGVRMASDSVLELSLLARNEPFTLPIGPLMEQLSDAGVELSIEVVPSEWYSRRPVEFTLLMADEQRAQVKTVQMPPEASPKEIVMHG